MKKECRDEIYNLVKEKLKTKFETDADSFLENKPFFEAIFSKKQLAVGSMIQSTYTSFGMSIYEQIAVILAKYAGFEAERQYDLLGEIDEETNNFIHNHCEDIKKKLKTKDIYIPNKNEEISKIKSMIKPGKPKIHGDSTVDLFIRNPETGEEFYFDITTVKNNLKGFQVLKEKMLKWVALRSSINNNVDIKTMIVVPYNPYSPDDYFEKQWNAKILDPKEDIMIQEEFWNFVGDNPNTYEELIKILEDVGRDLSKIINDYFDNLNNKEN